MNGPPSRMTISPVTALLSRNQRMTSFYTALCVYLACLTGFLGWWARFPR